MADVVIIGGGVIGLSTAYYLARAGTKVCVLERGGNFGQEASWAGAGIIPPGNLAGAETSYDRLRAFSSQLYADFSVALRDATGIDNGYRVCGGVEFFHDDPTEMLDRWRAEGIPFQRLTARELNEHEPNVQPSGAMIWLPGMAQVRNPRHVQALVAACQSLGVALHTNQEVTQFTRIGQRVEAARTASGATWVGDVFMLAGGAWSDQLLQYFGVSVGIHPVRGQIVLYRCATPPFRAVLCDDKNYLVCREDGRVLVGATEEPDAGFTKANTPEGVAHLTQFAAQIVPCLAHAVIEKTWSGLRPGTPDRLPYMGAIPDTTNAYIASGHYRAGVQLSPGTGHLLAALITHQPLVVDLSAFRVNRPIGRKVAPAFRS